MAPPLSWNSIGTSQISEEWLRTRGNNNTLSSVYLRIRVLEKSVIEWYKFPLNNDGESSSSIPSLSEKDKPLFSSTEGSMFSSIVGLGSYIYIFGGYDDDCGKNVQSPSKRAQRFNTADPNPELEYLTPMSIGRRTPRVVVLKDKIYVMGGCMVTAEDDYKWAEVYDHRSKNWECLPPVKIKEGGRVKEVVSIYNVLKYPGFKDKRGNEVFERDGSFGLVVKGPNQILIPLYNGKRRLYVYDTCDKSLEAMKVEEPDNEYGYYAYHSGNHNYPAVFGDHHYFARPFLKAYRFDKDTSTMKSVARDISSDNFMPVYVNFVDEDDVSLNAKFIFPRIDASTSSLKNKQLYAMCFAPFEEEDKSWRWMLQIVCCQISEQYLDSFKSSIKSTNYCFIPMHGKLVDAVVIDHGAHEKVSGFDPFKLYSLCCKMREILGWSWNRLNGGRPFADTMNDAVDKIVWQWGLLLLVFALFWHVVRV